MLQSDDSALRAEGPRPGGGPACWIRRGSGQTLLEVGDLESATH